MALREYDDDEYLSVDRGALKAMIFFCTFVGVIIGAVVSAIVFSLIT